MRRIVFACLLLLLRVEAASASPLASWNDGPATARLIAFVESVSKPGGKDFVPPAERIAVFDNDGTLWAEQPLYFQLAFALDRVQALAPAHPEWKAKEPFETLLAGDAPGALAQGEKAVLEILAATHTGMTTEAFATTVRDWIATAKHPTLGKRYVELTYRPMVELLAYLRANAFKTFIVSGGGVEFMRALAEDAYGIPPEQVIGSSGVTTFELRPSGPVLLKEPKVEFIDDGPGKPSGINRVIGRRPILAFGNSDGDQQMLEWTAAGTGARFVGLVHHTDAKREWAYDRTSHVGKLDKALVEATAKDWVVVDMARDWRKVFVFE